MKRCIFLACTHFFFGVIYSLGVMLLSPETAGFLVLLVIFPLALTMSAFYIWIFNSLQITLDTLGKLICILNHVNFANHAVKS